MIEEESQSLTQHQSEVASQKSGSQPSHHSSSKKASPTSAKSESKKSTEHSQEEKEEEVKPSRGSGESCWKSCFFMRSRSNRSVKTISDEDLGELTEAEQELMDEDWKDFKEDVSMKTLINQLDRAIKRRRRLYISDDEATSEKIKSFRALYSRLKPIKLVALTLYILLPLFEKPAWCLKNENIDTDTSRGYWYCQDPDGFIANSNLPKLPSNATNLTFIACLIIMFFFTKARDYYRKRDEQGDTVTMQLTLIVIAIVDLCVVEIVLNVNYSQQTRDDNLFVNVFIYPYLNAFIRPVLVSLTVRSVKSFWRRYLTVIMGSLPMVIFIVIYVFYFAWMGNRLFAGTIEGVESFSTLNDSFFYMFVLLTTSNFPDVMLPSYGQQRRNSIFFIVFLVIGLFMLMNLLLAIFYSNYQERVEASIDKFKEKRNSFLIQLFRKYDVEGKGQLDKKGVRSIIEEIHSLVNGLDKNDTESLDMTELQFEQVFKLLDQDNSGAMDPKEMASCLQAYETWQYEKQYKSAMEDLYSDNQVETIASQDDGIYKRALRVVSGPRYELAMNIITIINVVSVFFRALQQSATEASIRNWIIAEMVVNICMLLETIADIAVAGPVRAYQYHFRIWPETLCQLLNLPASIQFFRAGSDFQQYNYTVKIFEVIVFIRMLKLLTLLYEIKTMRVIFETLKNLLGPLNNLIIVMLTIFYVFAQIGMVMFGGQIKENSPQIVHDSSIPDNYYLINFNDLMASFITLFILIVVNNWYVIVAMCVDIKSGNLAYRYFFIVFYYFGVIIGLNIIIAFAIDMYSAVQRLEETKDQNREYLVKLAEQQHTEFVSQNKVVTVSDTDKTSNQSLSFAGSDDGNSPLGNRQINAIQ